MSIEQIIRDKINNVQKTYVYFKGGLETGQATTLTVCEKWLYDHARLSVD